MTYPSTLKSYLFLKRNRAKKKRAVKKQLWQMSMDKTTAFYLVILGAYVFASIFIFNDYLKVFEDEFIFIEKLLAERFWLILSIVPIRYVFQAFRHPGVLITSSEYQLAMLPHSIKKIALYIALEKWIKLLLQYLLVSMVVIMITPINWLLVCSYFLLFWCVELFMTIPQWKLFQSHLFVKVSYLVLIVSLSMIGELTDSNQIIGTVTIIGVLVANIYFGRSLFDNVHWGRVTEVNDYLVWNMPLVSKAIKVKFKRQRRYNMFQNRASRRKPFQYHHHSIHKRLWLQLFRENVEYILQVIAGLFSAIIIFAFISELVTFIGIAISVHVYTSFVTSIYRERFVSGIVQILPWDVVGYRHTITRWIYVGFVPIMIPIIIYAIIHYSWWSIGLIGLVVSVFLLNVETKLDNMALQLDKKLGEFAIKDFVSFGSLGFIILFYLNPYYSLLSIIIILYYMYQKKGY
ncbi:hypothetical protein [Ornithinibacillus scapharcae]|uniref:hypothetical protein n=1 Tax=Ornithinibacillus scapharcae TaxID=1147159 RepID=UPI000225BE4C|nr:hypothetical protein [Ornithinibacillus scapharcae]